MKIKVQRIPADKQGPDIIDPLLTSEVVGVARGTREIDYSASKMVERGNCPLLPFIPTGKFVAISMPGQTLKGKVTQYSFTIDISTDGKTFSPSSSVTIERLL